MSLQRIGEMMTILLGVYLLVGGFVGVMFIGGYIWLLFKDVSSPIHDIIGFAMGALMGYTGYAHLPGVC